MALGVHMALSSGDSAGLTAAPQRRRRLAPLVPVALFLLGCRMTHGDVGSRCVPMQAATDNLGIAVACEIGTTMGHSSELLLTLPCGIAAALLSRPACPTTFGPDLFSFNCTPPQTVRGQPCHVCVRIHVVHSNAPYFIWSRLVSFH